MNLLFSIVIAVAFFAVTGMGMELMLEVERASLWYLIPFVLSVVLLLITYELRWREVVIHQMTLAGVLKIAASVALNVVNILGILVYIPLLLAVGMALGSPGVGEDWERWLIPIGAFLFGPLCITGALSKKRPYLGFVGLAILGFAVGASEMLH
ncbi:hypothetical protein [Stutzerimonas azotifigens]|uniref:Uncharacterized protein n=1 Tax=Stutzerimonas azotifigens TaxID=291995 RepID=A0ABR5Z3T3_9GAMM|nr:hypothetical protein [Stutzerimonas azotifigens]MBA1274873.1 hypothetical protein [Stutzerimonas azotifigens]